MDGIKMFRSIKGFKMFKNFKMFNSFKVFKGLDELMNCAGGRAGE